jgi:hypothetical protein
MRAAAGRLEFSRFATPGGDDRPRWVAYALNANREIEISLWPDSQVAPGAADAPPARYPVLSAATRFELQYLAADLKWVDAWPRSESDAPLPLAVRLHLVLASGEDLVRVFSLR